ncbi:MAG: TIGR00268 family protein, partial [Clostridia bacterium]|nr:TIGR00268 family protein [Clostridia bacterium]
MTHTGTVPQSLRAFFEAHPRLALAFSGGVDSAYLLYAARACGCDVAPFYARSAFQPECERRDALRLAAQLGVALNEEPLDVLAVEAVRLNPANRC